MSDEAVGELVFLVEHTDHLVFLNDEHGAIFSRPATRVLSDWPAPPASDQHPQSLPMLGVLYGKKPGLLFLVMSINDRVDRPGDPAGSQTRKLSGLRLS
jgi:hypothetical protein